MRMILAAAAAASLCAAAGCAKERAAAPETGDAAAKAPAAAPETPASLIGASWDEKLAEELGETITVKGEFLGGDPESFCEFASTTRKRPAKTSWDWLIRKDGRCVCVTRGADPRAYNRIFGAPEAILDRANVGRKVEISARVAADSDGRLYLEFENGRPLD